VPLLSLKMLRRFFEFYINASIHVALAVIALVCVTYKELGYPLTTDVLGYVFFGTISAYNFVKYAKAAGLHHRSLTTSMRAIQMTSILSTLALFYFAFQVSITVIYASTFLAAVTFLYAIPVVFQKNLRTFSGIKIFLVALVWAGATVLIPWANASAALTSDVWLSFAQRFLIVMAYTLPFEIRDLPYDAPSLRTFPQQFGIKKVKIMGVLLLLIALLLEGFKDDVMLPHFLSLGMLTGVITLLLWRASTNQSRFYASFWVESAPFVWLGSFYVLTYLLTA